MSVRKSLLWSYSAQAFIFVLNFGTSIVVARLLGPYELGIFAVGASTAGALAIVSAFGVGPYLVRHREPDASVAATVFTVNAITNALVSAALFAVAAVGPLLGMVEGIRDVLFLLAFGPLIGIFAFLPDTFLQREMQFGTLSVIAMVRSVASAAILVSMALAGFGSLSPAIAVIGSSLVGLAIYCVVGRRHVSVRLGFAGWRDVTRFGLQMMSIGGIATFVQRLSELILGRFLGVAALGVYTRASGLANQVWDNVYGISTRVIFTQMASEMRESGTVRRTFIHGIAILTALIWPLLLGLAILSRPLIHLLYGEAWGAAAIPLSLLLMAHLVALGFGMNWELCVLKNLTGWQARNELVRAVVGLGAFSFGAMFSLVGAAAGRIVEALAGLVLFGPRMREMAGTERGEIFHVYRQTAILSLLATGPSAALMFATRWSLTTSWWWIAATVAIGVALWTAGICLLDHPLWAEARRALASLATRRRLRAA